MADWPSFGLRSDEYTAYAGGVPYTATYAYPGPRNAIRDSFSVTWERRRDPNDPDTEQERAVFEIALHVDCKPPSTASVAYNAFAATGYINNLVLHLGTTPGAASYHSFHYEGTWTMVRCVVDDHGNGCSTVRITAQRKGDTWRPVLEVDGL